MAENIKRLIIETAGVQIKQRNWTGMGGVKMATSVASQCRKARTINLVTMAKAFRTSPDYFGAAWAPLKGTLA